MDLIKSALPDRGLILAQADLLDGDRDEWWHLCNGELGQSEPGLSPVTNVIHTDIFF